MIKNENEKELLKELKEMAKKLEPITEKAKKNHDEMMKKDIMKMTKKELIEIENFKPEGEFDSVVIVPIKENHDSGFSCMKFILLRDMEIIGAVSGWSDVIHLNGIGGYGKNLENIDDPKNYSWSIDCLPKSKCVRFFCNKYMETDKFIGSDFIVYTKEQQNE